jgi:hypothetical protein
LRVTIVVCGQIDDAHSREPRTIPNADVVATCDSQRDLAMQAGMQFDVPCHDGDLTAMQSVSGALP